MDTISSFDNASLKELLLPFFGQHTDALLLQSEGRLSVLLKLSRKLYVRQSRLFDAAAECGRRVALEELGSQLLKSSGPKSDRILAALLGQTRIERVQEASLLNKGDDLYELNLSALLKTAAKPREGKNNG